MVKKITAAAFILFDVILQLLFGNKLQPPNIHYFKRPASIAEKSLGFLPITDTTFTRCKQHHIYKRLDLSGNTASYLKILLEIASVKSFNSEPPHCAPNQPRCPWVLRLKRPFHPGCGKPGPRHLSGRVDAK